MTHGSRASLAREPRGGVVESGNGAGAGRGGGGRGGCRGQGAARASGWEEGPTRTDQGLAPMSDTSPAICPASSLIGFLSLQICLFPVLAIPRRLFASPPCHTAPVTPRPVSLSLPLVAPSAAQTGSGRASPGERAS